MTKSEPMNPKQTEDTKPFIHGSEGTHTACPEMVEKLGSKVGCCTCNNHACTPLLDTTTGVKSDIETVLIMLEGDTDRKKIANYIREYMLKE